MAELIPLELLRENPLFSSQSDADLKRIIQAPENGIEVYEPKQLIISQGDFGYCMYIILEGVVNVIIRSESGGREITVNTLRPGDFFGERALMPGRPNQRNASIKAMRTTKVFRIDHKYAFPDIEVDGNEDDITEDHTAYFLPDEVRDTLEKTRLFKSLNYSELKTVRDWTEIVSIEPGRFIFKEAQDGDFMYVVLDGKVEIFTLDQDGNIVVLATLGHSHFFGEQALMPGGKGKRNAFARTESESRLIKIPKEYFHRMLERDSDLVSELQRVHTEQKEKLNKARQN